MTISKIPVIPDVTDVPDTNDEGPNGSTIIAKLNEVIGNANREIKAPFPTNNSIYFYIDTVSGLDTNDETSCINIMCYSEGLTKIRFIGAVR